MYTYTNRLHMVYDLQLQNISAILGRFSKKSEWNLDPLHPLTSIVNLDFFFTLQIPLPLANICYM